MTNTLESVMVESSAIYSAEYNSVDNTMLLYFNNEGIYKYHNVPRFYWRGLFDSSSKGKFINKFVLNKFSFDKLS